MDQAVYLVYPEAIAFEAELCFAGKKPDIHYSFFFSPRDLRAPSADRREIVQDEREL